jgi:imidazoleglycerol-phosphate dehydratase
MRKSKIERKTKETEIKLELNIDGKGDSGIKTGIPFFDHMLTLMSKHGLFDLKIKAKGDLDVDFHHLVEDVGICIGKTVNEALGKKAGIRRYGFALTPMDEALAMIALDISGRGCLVFNAAAKKKEKNSFDLELAEEFFTAMSRSGNITLHINVLYGKNLHHIIEAMFKGVGRALGEAFSIDKRVKGIPSTKGKL